jgi:hypothetical protein
VEGGTSIKIPSVKDLGNTVNRNPKWSRTLPFLIYFSWVINRDPTLHNLFSNIKVDNAPQAHSRVSKINFDI